MGHPLAPAAFNYDYEEVTERAVCELRREFPSMGLAIGRDPIDGALIDLPATLFVDDLAVQVIGGRRQTFPRWSRGWRAL